MQPSLLVVLAGALVSTLGAQQPRSLQLASPFVDDMILQRQMPVPVWGWAPPDSGVTVAFAGQKHSTTSDARGEWRVRLGPLQTSIDERSFTVRCGNGETVTCKGVLVGEVWLASGQSNMDWTAGKSMCRDLANRLARSKEDEPIREYNVDIGSSLFVRSRAECKDGWKRSRQASGFSALALAFAWKLHDELNVPIGILRATHGATAIETWTAYEGLVRHPELKAFAEGVRQADPTTPEGKAAFAQFERDLKTWQKESEARLNRGGTALPRPSLPGILEQWKGATRMYNKKIAPLVPFAIRGAIWCQGTHNSNDGKIYATKMHALVDGWRENWGRPDLPFYFTQMQCYGQPNPEEAGFADIREAQRLFFMNSNHVGMVLQHDLNPQRPAGIHNYNKLHPGLRLARWALAHEYGKDIAYSGPIYRAHEIDGGTVRVQFEQRGPGGGLMVGSKGMEADARKNPDAYVEPARETKGKKLQHFRLAGKDRIWHAADAVIEGGEVVVTSAAVPEPVGVQYAYSASPIGANLYNSAGLPATPFAFFAGKQLFQEDLPAEFKKKNRRAPKPKAPYVQVATLFRPHAVIQRDMSVPVWGFALPGTKITVQFGDQTKTAVTGEFEHWRVTLDPLPASAKGRDLRIASSDGATRTVKDVVVGDLWVLTGTTQLARELLKGEAPEAMPLVREFRIRTNARRFRAPRKRQMEIGGGKYRSFWKPMTFGEERLDVTVAGYHFAKQVQQPGVPVGLITLGADNPPITWISYEGLQTAKGFEKERDERNLLYPNTESGKHAVTSYLATLREYFGKVAAARQAGKEIPDELAASAPAFPQPQQNQWAKHTENATLTYNFCISPLTPGAVRGVVWLPGLHNIGENVGRYANALEAVAKSLPATYGQPTVPFVYAQPAAALVEGIAQPEIANAKYTEFEAWPKGLRELATKLGALAAKTKK